MMGFGNLGLPPGLLELKSIYTTVLQDPRQYVPELASQTSRIRVSIKYQLVDCCVSVKGQSSKHKKETSRLQPWMVIQNWR